MLTEISGKLGLPLGATGDGAGAQVVASQAGATPDAALGTTLDAAPDAARRATLGATVAASLGATIATVAATANAATVQLRIGHLAAVGH